MKLNEIMSPELLRMSIKKNRGRHIKRFVKSASKQANPNVKGKEFTPGANVIADKPEMVGQDHFSGLF
jgi:hypothetical protein